MDLIPKPDQVVSAASNVAHMMLYGGLADLRPMPRTLIDEGNLRETYHYRPVATVTPTGDPVLLVTPLAAPASCFDLRRGCSLVEHFVTGGRPTYLVEYGQVSFKDRNLGMEHWIDQVIPEAIRAVSQHSGGRRVHVIGWSLGGIFAALSAADQPDLPIASLSVLGTPFDVSQVPLVAPLRPLLNLDVPESWRPVTRLYQAIGGAPQPLVRWAYQLSSFQKLVTKPIALVKNLDDTEFLAQIEAVDKFTAGMTAYPGRTFGQLYHRFVRGNDFRTGSIHLDERTIEMSSITAPVLVFAGASDGIAPVGSVRALVPLLSGSGEVRFEIVPGGHLGMLTGRGARATTWAALDDWVEQWSAPKPGAQGGKPTGKPSGKPTGKPIGKAGRTTKPVAKKTKVSKKPQPKRTQIGSNPQRRYDSKASRGLGVTKGL